MMEEEKRIKAREAWRKWYECHKEENKERTYNYRKTEKGKKSHNASINKYRQKNRERVNELARLRYKKKKQNGQG